MAQITPDFYMQMALDYAWGFQCLALPNPTVAALVLDKNGAIIALEAHTRCGESHAELKALAAAFANLTGDSTPLTLQNPFEMFDFLAENHRGVFNETTIFSTLEPCNHRGKTPSCAEILALVRPKKIYISTRDSHERAKGGIERLKNADIALLCGVLEERGRDLLLPFLCLQERGRFTLYKLATRLNGDFRGGVISCEKSRAFSHKLRSVAERMVVSQRTILEDDPLLDSRLAGGRAPDLLILGRKNKLRENLRIFNPAPRESAPRQNTAKSAQDASRQDATAHPQNTPAPLENPHAQPRRIEFCESVEHLNLQGFSLLEGGAEFFSLMKDKIDCFLCFVAPQMRTSSGFLADFSGRLLHAGESDRDAVLWLR